MVAGVARPCEREVTTRYSVEMPFERSCCSLGTSAAGERVSVSMPGKNTKWSSPWWISPVRR